MTTGPHDVMPRHEDPVQALEGRIAVGPAHMALRHQAVLEGLLPAPHSAVALHGTGPSLTERAIQGIAEGALAYKGVLVAPLIAAVVEIAAGALHYAPHAAAVGGAVIAGSTVIGAVGSIATLAHITNPPDPHHIATHHAGHAGKIIATAFGMFIGGVAFGLTTWLGLLSAGSAAGGILTTLGAGIAIGVRIHEAHPQRQIRDTDRIRAVAEYAAATATAHAAPNYAPHTPASVHPIAQQVVWAMAQNGFAGAYADAMPTVLSAERWALTMNHPGIAARKVIARLDDLAATLQVVNGGLKIARGENEHQTVWSVNNVPLAALEAPGAHPMIEAQHDEVSIWDPMAIGLDDDGNPVGIVLAGTPGMLIAGNPRMGKSNIEAGIVCTIVRARDCRLRTIDASQRELPIFDDVADRHVGADIDDAIRLLAELQDEITDRGPILKNARTTELTREIAEKAEIDCIALVIDELHHFTNHADKKKATDFAARLGNIVARGGAVGVFVVVATQKPQADIIPSSVRDMIDIKFALRCETFQQVNTILGESAHKQCPAHDLKRTDKGVGYLKGLPDRDACRVRTHLIGVEERYAIVDQYAADFVATPPPDDPGGGEDADADQDAAPRRTGLYLVRNYPDKKPVGENYVALWNALDQFDGGLFTYRDVAALGVMKSRGSVQGPLDMWRRLGYIVPVEQRRGQAGPTATVYRKATPAEFGEDDEGVRDAG